MRVTTLVENDRPETRTDLTEAFGLSLYVETGDARVLFDTGPSPVLVENAEVLGVELAMVQSVVLSHQHYDHGGGLEAFFEVNDSATVFLRDCPVHERTAKVLGVIKRSVGIDAELVERHRDRFQFVSGRREIAPGFHLLTEIGNEHDRPRGNRILYTESDGGLIHDPFDHELVMAVEEHDGLVVFTGCSHSGILNMVDAAIAAFPGVPVKAVFGGFHLIGLPFYDSMSASRPEVRAIGDQLRLRVQGTVYSGHCTGNKAFSVLAEVMGDRLDRFRTGTVVEI
jgi:7,8-dihydropterin-6-yl-methyl-4-(beta-D-ribofuranosyl)aminobenzene 5'-phosphate synthase